MKKKSLRNGLATGAIISCNVVVLLLLQLRSGNISEDIGSLAGTLAVSTTLSGIVGGIIAPYTYKRVVLYVEAILAIIVLIGGIIIFAIGQGVGTTDNAFAELAIILILVILVAAILIGAVVSGIGLFLGAFIGSKIGKAFTHNYTEKSGENENFSSPAFQSQM